MKILKVFDSNQNILNKFNEIIALIDDLKDSYRKLSDKELYLNTKYFLKRIELGESIDDMISEILATVREAAFRVHKIFAFKVQLMGALTIYEGNFAEMKTGEGKTLVIVLSAYILALKRKGVHIITVNEYLVKRDAEFCRKIFNFLGLTVGFNTPELNKKTKKKMFACDVTYTVNSELAFDYLRDNMSFNEEEIVIPRLSYAIIDEGDSILIDEASTPLIISVSDNQNLKNYIEIDIVVKKLNESDYTINWENKSVILLSSGILKIEEELNLKKLYSFNNSVLVNKVHNSLIANFIFSNGKEYIVHDNKIVLIDQNTGRILSGRSYNNGLQQAIQAKEYLKIEQENKIAAKTTYQSFFRQYKSISGLSGTAISESKEFMEIYNMIVVKVPTNKKVIRLDLPDIVFGNKKIKIKSIVNEIQNHYVIGQPVLVGTSSVEESENIYYLLQKKKIPCEILNAKNHEREAEIISKAGSKYAITIATNIAGRGVDIKIDDEVAEMGGLYVLGCEKNESNRVDNQLRGRSGRQGDPGKSIFFISLEDNLFKRFGTDKFDKLSKKLKNEFFDNKFFQKTINGIQKKIHAANYDARKHLIEYDELISLQQKIIYKQRLFVIKNQQNEDLILKIMKKIINNLVNDFLIQNVKNQNMPQIFAHHLNEIYFSYPIFLETDFLNNNITKVKKFILNIFGYTIKSKFQKLKHLNLNSLLKEIIVKNIDLEWQNHLELSSKIKNSINLRSLEQKSPLNIYVEEVGSLFDKILFNCRKNILIEIINLPNAFVAEECYQFSNKEREKLIN